MNQAVPQTEYEERLADALQFQALLHDEGLVVEGHAERLAQLRAEFAARGTVEHTPDELTHGTRIAWRNSTRCVGKFSWQQLHVRDCRHLRGAEEVFGGLVDHLRAACNGGRTRLLLSVFAPQQPGQPGLRVWNSQLIGYAGYRQADGTVVGDPANVELTDAIRALGWPGGPGTRFDLLPVVLHPPGEAPRLFELPADAVLEVPITHPTLPWFADLGLKWYSHPAISNMRLDLGGVSYTAAPFSAWYTAAEIGARNLSDVNRYDMLPEIARRMGLDTRRDRTLWKDRALLELTTAVMFSFERRQVSILDHHTVARQFVLHEEREARAGRVTPADWRTMVAPLSASTTATFGRTYPDVILRPNFFDQPTPWVAPQAQEPEPPQPPRPATGQCPVHPVNVKPPAVSGSTSPDMSGPAGAPT